MSETSKINYYNGSHVVCYTWKHMMRDMWKHNWNSEII